MKWLRRLFVSAALAALILVALLSSQQSQPAAPFLETPTLAANAGSAGATVAARGPDGKYALFSFSPSPPFGLLSSMQQAMSFVSGFAAPPPQSSAGPPGVGLASQLLAGFVDGTHVLVGAWVSQSGTGSVFISRLDLSTLSYHTATYNVGPFPAGVIAADFNRDGQLDFAVPFLGNGSSPGGVAILLNNGSGGFTPQVVYSAGFSPIGVAAFDLNGDGIPDLAVADNGSASSNGGVWVLIGKGDGTFSPATAYPAGVNPLTVTIADFNGDGIPDLAAGAGDGSVSILLGKGNGTFSAASSFKVESSVAYLAAGDFNSDGHMDLAAAAFDGTVSVFLGSGSGTFQPKSAYIVSHKADLSIFSLILTDYNGDGKLDIINGTGDARGFGPGYNPQVDVLLGNGDGTFQGAALYPTGRSTTESAIGDFNGDGKPDVVAVGSAVSSSGGNVFLGNGDGTFRAGAVITTPDPASSVDVADFNRDGKLDIVTNSDILLGNGDGTFQPANTLPVTGSLVRAWDFNHDGKPDVAVVTSGAVTILLGTGAGSFSIGQSYTIGAHPSGMVLGDFNGDGNQDLAVVTGAFNGDPAAVTILLGKGDGTFQPPTSTFVGQGPYFGIAIGDFNGDGKPDLAVPYEQINTQNPPYIAILLGNGDGTFRAPINVPAPNDGNPFAVAAADFNGDNKPDLVVAGCCGATQMLYLAGNGDGTFQSAIPFLGGPSPVSIAVADLNGDHKPDLVVTDRGSGGATSGAILPLLNSSAVSTQPSIISTGPPSGSNLTQTFTVTFSDPSGVQNLQVVDVLINNVLDGRHACYVAFVPSSNSVFLVDDAGDAGGPYQGLVLPASTSIGNSQCTVSGSGSSASVSGNNLTLSLAITFSSSFNGNKVVYASAQDKSAADSGWQALATWNVPGAPVSGPGVTGMIPARTNSSGPTNYAFTFTDTSGWQDISIANVLIASAIDGRHACYIAFQPATSSVFLVDDTGDAAGPFQGLVLPASGSIGNSQCTINGAGSTVAPNGNTLTLTLSIAFNQSFAGNQLFYLAARNNNGGNSNWQSVGSVSVP